MPEAVAAWFELEASALVRHPTYRQSASRLWKSLVFFWLTPQRFPEVDETVWLDKLVGKPRQGRP